MAIEQSKPDNYIFSRNVKSTIRLNYHHWISKEICGFLLHPSIPTNIINMRVADIGAGTGIWAIEMRKLLPESARIDSFDISEDQFPVRGWMPLNLHWHRHNAFDPFPEDHLGVYDALQIRYFLTLVRPTNVASLVKNLAALLKPGGYLQWLDPDVLSVKPITVEPSGSTDATETMIGKMGRPNPQADFRWLRQLNETLSQAGLENTVCHCIPVKNEHRELKMHLQVLSHGEICDKNEALAKEAETLGNIEEAEEKMEQAQAGRQRISQLEDEFKKGTALESNYLCFVARKPL